MWESQFDEFCGLRHNALSRAICNDVCNVVNRSHANTYSSSTRAKSGEKRVTRTPGSPAEALSIEIVAITMSIKKQIHKHRLECIFSFDICVGFFSTFFYKIVIIHNKLA